MEFANPWLLWLLPIVFLPVLAAYFGKRYKVFSSKLQPNRKYRFVLWMRIVGAMLISFVALLGIAYPVHTEYIQDPYKNGVDIEIVLDLSKSMLAEDISPNRISVGKKILEEFISNRSQDRIWIIGFAGKPFIFWPLTFDHIWLLSIVHRLEVDSIKQEIPGFSGTAIGDALLLAEDALGTTDQGKERKKIIILVTDGEANIGIDPKIAGEYVKNAGSTVYTIGIGDPKWTELYTTDQRGKRQYFLDENGKPIRASIDEALLRKLAEDTGWTFANALSTDELREAFKKIDATLGTPIKTPPDTMLVPSMPWIFLILGILATLWYILEMLSPISAFHIRTLNPINITPESTNYIVSKKSIYIKHTTLSLGILLCLLTIFHTPFTLSPGPITILLDISKSMSVEDVGASRLALAKEIAKKIISEYPAKPIRLMVFSGDSEIITPATLDATSLNASIDSISEDWSSGWSDIVSAIHGASNQTGTLFVLSDGEAIGKWVRDSENFPIETPENMIIHTYGIWSLEGWYIPLWSDLFGNRVYKQINWVPIRSKLEESLLQQIARDSGGQYTRIDSQNTPLHLPFLGNQIDTSVWESIRFIWAILILLAINLPYRRLRPIQNPLSYA